MLWGVGVLWGVEVLWGVGRAGWELLHSLVHSMVKAPVFSAVVWVGGRQAHPAAVVTLLNLRKLGLLALSYN